MKLPDALAREIISSHQQRPRNVGTLPDAAHAERQNPGCGDQITVWVQLSGEHLRLSFEGKGCAISQASASLMTERLGGLTRQEAADVAAQFRAMVQGEPPAETLGELAALAGVSKLLARRRCALLAWDALQEALD
ncbi:SUF system NifU family Fe-S cluster assembly protein [Deinococcus rubellus]|uniref:SUF system NifU family Fe-S cluster assembly protein n=1 Tax=Deinococcus rubellus TaxID=1889240 RepID=A0ABY5YJ04_9DEIO|nr:SUF system NifU family Fe-S cluster assembly protein [Deinococcus rubellus]UWX65100.1 SUF system NifU family Fe-S cluster assembly protein [Deinococcus rubellus]